MAEELGLRERKKLETRRHLAQTALGLFLERGFDEVSVAEVAEAAGVSKMTVFNHFPAKEELVFELTTDRGLPDLAAAVRERAPGVSAIAAIRAAGRSEFERQAEVNDEFEAQVPRFIRMVFRSPTLMQGFGRRWITVQTALGIALAEETGVPAPRGDVEQEFFSAVRSDTGADVLKEVVGAIGGASLPASIVAAQAVAVLQQVTMLNLVRGLSGVPRAESAREAITDLETAFDLLERGLADYAVKA